jgi:MarR family transcriptional regulator, lower aerobic nicotinate degradation pathway regulator
MSQDDFKAANSPLSSALHLLFRAGQRADRLFARQVEMALTVRQLMVLQAVSEANAPSQMDIGIATGIDRSSIADLVKRLVSYGWLRRRHPKGDARSYIVSLTVAGERILASGRPAVRAAENCLLSSVAASNREILVSALKALADGDQLSG